MDDIGQPNSNETGLSQGTPGQICAEKQTKQDFESSSQALAKLSQATAIIVGTLLAVPDAIALVPNSETPISWLLRLLGVWLSAVILWFVAFLGILHIVRFLSGGIQADDQGIRLWRFGRKISWTSIAAISCEPQKIFSFLAGYRPPASRLVLYIEKAKSGSLAPREIPSFWFSEEVFSNLYQTICQKTFAFVPQSENALVTTPSRLVTLKRITRLRQAQRALLTLVIAFGLVFWLGRKACVNYTYASGNREFKQGFIPKAKAKFELATKLDPTFAVAWNNLAGAEFRLGQVDKAKEHWEIALSLKPDLVEAKVSLAYLALKEREFARAKELLDRARKLDPWNLEALINSAELNMREGHVREAVRYARQALTKDKNNKLATCLLAQGRLRLGSPKAALLLLEKKSDLHSSSNATTSAEDQFCLLVKAETHLALSQTDQAEALYAKVLSANSMNVDALLGLANVYIIKGKPDQAEPLLDLSCQISPQNPWVWLIRARLALSRNDQDACLLAVTAATAKPGQDTNSYAEAARLSQILDKTKQAVYLAEQALKIEPTNVEAQSVLQSTNQKK